MVSRRIRYLLFISMCVVFLVSTFSYQRRFSELPKTITSKFSSSIHGGPAPPPPEQIIPNPPSPPPPHPPPPADEEPKHKFKYKPAPSIVPDPIIENFPLAAAAHSPNDLPPIPPWNQPPAKHVPENTPLFIGFTRNWRILQQVVVSYITAGWPPEDIYVVENTGVFDSNAQGLLSLQNPFFLNHTRLHLFGVNIIIAPTLFSFAQLQNYYISLSIEKGWKQYFWGHMDMVALSFEDSFVDAESGADGKDEHETKDEASAGALDDAKNEDADKYKDFKSLYMNCVQALREATKKDQGSDEERRWAMRFFNYDKLALVNVAGFMEVGAWDTQIPYYATDCDMHARLNMAGLEIRDAPAGFLVDVGESLNDLYTLYRKTDSPPAAFIDPQVLEEKEKQESMPVKSRDEDNNEMVSHSRDVEMDPTRRATTNPDLEVESEKDIHNREVNSTDTDTSNSSWYTHHLSPNSPSPSPSSEPEAPPAEHSAFKSDTIGSPSFTHLHDTILAMQESKNSNPRGRNTWQIRQRGGQGEPFYRDALGFERGLVMSIACGREVFAEKWGHKDCDFGEMGLQAGDAWRVEGGG